MRVIKGTINAVLMATLVKPMTRLIIGRWRKRVQESPGTAIGVHVQELFEAALVEELAPTVADTDATPAEIAEIAETPEGRSTFGMLLLAGLVIAVTGATAYGIAELVKRRRAAQAAERELVAVPIEGDATDTIEDVASEALVGER